MGASTAWSLTKDDLRLGLSWTSSTWAMPLGLAAVSACRGAEEPWPMDGDALRISAASARLDCADISIVQGPEDEREVEDVEEGDVEVNGGRRPRSCPRPFPLANRHPH